MGSARAALVFALAGASCAPHLGTKEVDGLVIEREHGWLRVPGVPEVFQDGDKDCGAAALSAVLAYWGYSAAPREILAALAPAEGRGVRAGALAGYAKARGLEAFVFHGRFEDVVYELRSRRPVIVGVARRDGSEWRSHYEVVLGYHSGRRAVLSFDPAAGLRESPFEAFSREWQATERVLLVVAARGG